MSLIDTLRRAEFVGLTDEQAAAALAASGQPIVNRELQTIDAVFKVFGMVDTTTILNTLATLGAENPVVAASREKLITVGWDFSDPDRQSAIDFFGAVAQWSPEFIARFKAMGIQPQAVWQNEGLTSAPTVEEIHNARNQIAVNDFISQVKYELLDPSKTIDQMKTEIAALS